MAPEIPSSRAGTSSTEDRSWQFRGGVDAIGEQFENDLGFIPRRGINNYTGNIARAFRSPGFPQWLREIRPHWEFEMARLQEDGDLDQQFHGFHLPFSLSNGGFAEFGVNSNVEVIPVPFTLNPARNAVVLPGRHEFTEYFAVFNGDPSARVTPAIRYSFGTFYGGYKRSYAFGPSVRPNEKLSASLNLQINDIELPTGS